MKNIGILLFIFCISQAIFSQVGINTNSPDASSMLEISSTNKGILIPRMTEAQKNTISSPATGLLIFQTNGTTPGFYFYNGSSWDYLTANGAKEINDLSDGSTIYASLFLGDNVATTATALSTSNIGIGTYAFRYLTDGDFNVAIGPGASENIRTGNNNISIGLSAMSRNRTGDDNIAIGNYTGINSDIATSGNIFIGNWAGFNEFSGSNKLYIENSTANSNNALIYGEFDNDILRTNSEFQIGNPSSTGYRFPTTDGASGEVMTTDGTGNVSWQNMTNGSNEIGDVKTGMQATDHNGWIKLDGRALSTLTASQQVAATSLGLVSNLPSADNSVLIQNGNTLGSISGSNSRVLTQGNLPNVTFTGTTSSAGSHNHSFYTANNDVNNSSSQGYPIGDQHNAFRTTDRRQRTENNGTIQNDGNHTHTVSISSGGSNTPLNITPQSLSVNIFIYLGN